MLPFSALFGAILACFAVTAGFEFVSYDDLKHLPENPAMRLPLGHALVQIWSEPYFEMYIPLSYTFWRVLYAISSTSGIFHVASVLLHGLNACLVLLWLELVSRKSGETVESRTPLLLGALVFALHPLQVESVAWISEFRGLLSASFVLGAMILHLKSKGTSRWGWIALFIMAMLSKPSAVVLPLVILFQDWFVLEKRSVKDLARSWPAWIVALCFAVVANSIQGVNVDLVPDLAGRARIVAESVSFYAEKLFWPAGLIPVYLRSATATLKAPLTWESIVIPCVIALAILGTIRRMPLVSFGLLLWVAGLLPTLGLTTFILQNTSIVADRYGYLAMVGVALVIAELVTAAGKQSPNVARAVTVACAIVIAGLGLASALQTRIWRDNVSLYESMIDRRPDHHIAMASLGAHYLEAGDYKRAGDLLEQSIKLSPEHYVAHYTLGALMLRQGRNDELAELCRQWFPLDDRKQPMFRKAIAYMHHYCGVAFHGVGKMDPAIGHFESALALDPKFPYADDAYFRLGAIFLEQGNFAKAKAYFRSYLQVGGDPKKRETAMEQLRILDQF